MLNCVKAFFDLHHEKFDSAISYGVGTGVVAWAVNAAQNLTIFFGLLIVMVRLLYDMIRLYRYIRSERP